MKSCVLSLSLSFNSLLLYIAFLTHYVSVSATEKRKKISINVVAWLAIINYSMCAYVHSLFTVFPARATDSGDRHAGTQAGFQLALLASTLGISILGGLLTGEYTVLAYKVDMVIITNVSTLLLSIIVWSNYSFT